MVTVEVVAEMSSQAFIIALYTVQIIAKQLYRDKQENNDLMMKTQFTCAVKQL